MLIFGVGNECIGEKIWSLFHKAPPECLYEYPKQHHVTSFWTSACKIQWLNKPFLILILWLSLVAQLRVLQKKFLHDHVHDGFTLIRIQFISQVKFATFHLKNVFSNAPHSLGLYCRNQLDLVLSWEIPKGHLKSATQSTCGILQKRLGAKYRTADAILLTHCTIK